jgi:hypothetical protein
VTPAASTVIVRLRTNPPNLGINLSVTTIDLLTAAT